MDALHSFKDEVRKTWPLLSKSLKSRGRDKIYKESSKTVIANCGTGNEGNVLFTERENNRDKGTK